MQICSANLGVLKSSDKEQMRPDKDKSPDKDVNSCNKEVSPDKRMAATKEGLLHGQQEAHPAQRICEQLLH